MAVQALDQVLIPAQVPVQTQAQAQAQVRVRVQVQAQGAQVVRVVVLDAVM